MSNVDSFIKFLEGYGVRNIKLNGDELKMSCPFQGHANNDSTPSASINIEKQVYNCLSVHGGMSLKKFLEKLTGKKSKPAVRDGMWQYREFVKRNKYRDKKRVQDIADYAEDKVRKVTLEMMHPYKQSVDYHLEPITNMIWNEKEYLDKQLGKNITSKNALLKYSDWVVESLQLLKSTEEYIKKLGLRGEKT